MKKKYFWVVLMVVGVISSAGSDGLRAGHMGAVGEEHQKKDRPLYVYPGNYREEVDRLKETFKSAYGYELLHLDEGWRPEEIERLHNAFSRLPENFYRIEGLKGFYRAGQLQVKNNGLASQDVPDASGIPAATFPRFTSVYRQAHQSYQVVLTDEPLRIEFYNALFYESEDDFDNIVHHEMGHVFDLSHGFLTYQNEWLNLTGFHILHLPALDGKADSDFLYTLISDPGILNYGPVSSRHLPTYSRENPQEDFANSIAGFIHYPYLQYTHPKRYQYLKDHVFGAKEYFQGREGDFASLMQKDFKEALAKQDWPQVIRLVREQSRILDTSVENKMVEALRHSVDQKISAEADLQMAIASCYLIHPGALELRKSLLVTRRIQQAKVLRDARCRRMGRQVFEGDQAKWSLTHLQFYREEGKAKIQFLDPVALTAYARGFETHYQWRLSVTSPRLKVISQGESVGNKEPNGAFQIDLEKTAKGRYIVPEARELVLEVNALRSHPQKLKPLESPWTPIRFVVQPGYEYLGPPQASFRIIYPASWQSGR
ncbi:MAG: hypothetical protein OEM27_01440 [Nitrospinota bacterium]|nr:hypothetical protein [Nitrospinota bacterium]